MSGVLNLEFAMTGSDQGPVEALIIDSVERPSEN
jgi:hypothetical protein